MYEVRTFSDVLKEIRKEQGWSQEELAERLGTSKQVISRYENGLRSPKITTIAQYADKLDVSMEYLLGVESKNARKVAELIRCRDFRGAEEALGIPPGTISSLSGMEKAYIELELDSQQKMFNMNMARLRNYMSHVLPDFDDHDYENITLFIDTIAEKKRRHKK